MEIFLFIVILLGCLILGSFGFSQIIGCIKFFKRFPMASALLTIFIWLAILGFVSFAIINWLDKYNTALYIGYGISFILSFSVKSE